MKMCMSLNLTGHFFHKEAELYQKIEPTLVYRINLLIILFFFFGENSAYLIPSCIFIYFRKKSYLHKYSILYIYQFKKCSVIMRTRKKFVCLKIIVLLDLSLICGKKDDFSGSGCKVIKFPSHMIIPP